jgi:hypothetical protein
MNKICSICQKKSISDKEFEYSYNEFKMPICMACQEIA